MSRNEEWVIGPPGREQVATRWNRSARSDEDIYVADSDGEVLIELWAESDAGPVVVSRYLPADVLAEVLRRSGWTVSR